MEEEAEHDLDSLEQLKADIWAEIETLNKRSHDDVWANFHEVKENLKSFVWQKIKQTNKKFHLWPVTFTDADYNAVSAEIDSFLDEEFFLTCPTVVDVTEEGVSELINNVFHPAIRQAQLGLEEGLW